MRHEIWQKPREEAKRSRFVNRFCASHVYSCVLNHECLSSAEFYCC